VKAAIYKGINRIEIEEIDTPEMTTGTLVLKVDAVGVCGTDLKTYKRGHPFFQPPCILGHEVVGTVVRVNDASDGDLLGRTFAVPPYLGCGNCEFCKRGFSELCKNKVWFNGAFAEYILVPVELIRKTMAELDHGVNKVLATLTEPLACAIHGVKRLSIQDGRKVLVVGAGPMGLMISMFLRDKGCEVTLSEVNKTRVVKAQALGFLTIDANTVSLSEFSARNGKFDHSVIATESADIVQEVFNCVRPGGKVELFGGMPRSVKVHIDPYYVHYEEIDLIGSFGFSVQDFNDAFGELKIRHETYSKLITSQFTLDQIESAFEAAMRPENLKVIVSMH